MTFYDTIDNIEYSREHDLISMIIDEIIQFIQFPFRAIFSEGRISRTYIRIVEQIYEIGIKSLPILFIVAFFTGLVTTVQSAYQISNMLPKYFLGLTVGRMIMIELGPVLTALTITGRCVSAMAAEIGTMKITEQIDALRAFKIDPLNYLVKPRLIAMFITLPLLNGFMILVSLLVGATYAQIFYHTNVDIFFYGLTHPFHVKDFWISFIKSGFFAFWISSAGTYSGFTVRGGAKEVGQAATKAVVISTLLILVLDFIAALIFI